MSHYTDWVYTLSWGQLVHERERLEHVLQGYRLYRKACFNRPPSRVFYKDRIRETCNRIRLVKFLSNTSVEKATP